MDIATRLRQAAATFASFACFAALGCEPQEYADLRSEREIYIQKHLPEVHLVLTDLNREIAQHETRIADRAAKLAANGRAADGDAASRRWYALLEKMTRDRDELSNAADDVYFKYDELRLAGSQDPDGQEDLEGLMEEARSTAVEKRERLATYRDKLSGASSESDVAENESRSGVSVVFEDRTETIYIDDTSESSYGSEGSGEEETVAAGDSFFGDDAPMQSFEKESLVPAPDDETSRWWEDATGEFRVSALYRGMSDPGTDRARVWLRRDSDAGTISVPYDALSEEDRDYVSRRHLIRRFGG